MLQEPQCVLSLFRLVHDGLQKSGLIVVGQAQCPAWQLSAAGQAAAQAPQLPLSVCSLTHVVPQTDGAPEGHWQALDTQVWAARQLLPHVPQFAESLESVAHAPLQLAWPVGQPVVHA